MPGSISRRRLLRTAGLYAASAARVSRQRNLRPAAFTFCPIPRWWCTTRSTATPEQIAQTIGTVLKLDPARVKRAAEVAPADLEGINQLVVGSPTHAFNMLPSIRQFINSLPGGSLAGVRACVFDTRLSPAAVAGSGVILRVMAGWFGYAAQKIASALRKKGTRFSIEFAWFTVEDTEGPLSEGELERAARWAATLA